MEEIIELMRKLKEKECCCDIEMSIHEMGATAIAVTTEIYRDEWSTKIVYNSDSFNEQHIISELKKLIGE